MTSSYHITIRLDPHYQQFLRFHFGCDSEFFEFPCRCQFNTMLELMVVQKRWGDIVPDTDEWAFKIMLPVFNKKNPAFFRYLSEVKESLFKSNIKKYYDIVITARIAELMAVKVHAPGGQIVKYNRKECTLALIDEYGFNKDNQESFDRLYKLYTRYLQNERWDTYQIKKLNERQNVKNS